MIARFAIIKQRSRFVGNHDCRRHHRSCWRPRDPRVCESGSSPKVAAVSTTRVRWTPPLINGSSRTARRMATPSDTTGAATYLKTPLGNTQTPARRSEVVSAAVGSQIFFPPRIRGHDQVGLAERRYRTGVRTKPVRTAFCNQGLVEE